MSARKSQREREARFEREMRARARKKPAQPIATKSSTGHAAEREATAQTRGI
jgi:hypothetical protein